MSCKPIWILRTIRSDGEFRIGSCLDLRHDEMPLGRSDGMLTVKCPWRTMMGHWNERKRGGRRCWRSTEKGTQQQRHCPRFYTTDIDIDVNEP